MRQFAVILLLASGCALNADAQSFLDGLRAKNTGQGTQGTVTVTQSPEIDELVNNVRLLRIQPATPKKEPVKKPAQNVHDTASDKVATGKTPVARTNTEHKAEAAGTESGELPVVDTSKKVMRGGKKITGYRVQAFSGGNSRADRQKAARPSCLRAFLLAPVDMPCGKLPHLSGSQRGVGGNKGYGLPPGVHRKRQNHCGLLTPFIYYIVTAGCLECMRPAAWNTCL